MSVIKKGIVPSLLIVLSLSVYFLFAKIHSEETVRIGFIGGLTGRIADLGIPARDAVILAVEELNAQGGIHGKKLELLIRDDEQNDVLCREYIEELIRKKCQGIIGPMTSQMAVNAVPLCNRSDVLLISPTSSTNDLSHKDDCFYRMYPSSQEQAQRLAQYAWNEGCKKIGVLFDRSNKSHCEPFSFFFIKHFKSLGGQITSVHSFQLQTNNSFYGIAEEAIENDIDALLILANSMDTAMLCQQLMKMDRQMPYYVSEWSTSPEVIEYGGRSVEGLHFFRSYDDESKNPRYLDFEKRFKERFGVSPAFSSLYAYDAASVLLSCIKQSDDENSVLDVIRKTDSFIGLQGSVSFDEYGEINAGLYCVVVEDGHFINKGVGE